MPVRTGVHAVSGPKGEIVVDTRAIVRLAGVALDSRWPKTSQAGRITENACVVRALAVSPVGAVYEALIGVVVVENSRDIPALLAGC